MTREIGKGAISLLIEIASSDRHRAALESLEREREQRSLSAIPTTAIG